MATGQNPRNPLMNIINGCTLAVIYPHICLGVCKLSTTRAYPLVDGCQSKLFRGRIPPWQYPSVDDALCKKNSISQCEVLRMERKPFRPTQLEGGCKSWVIKFFHWTSPNHEWYMVYNGYQPLLNFPEIFKLELRFASPKTETLTAVHERRRMQLHGLTTGK